MPKTNNIDSSLKPGDSCYGLYLPAFRLEPEDEATAMLTDIYPGKAMSDYASRPKDTPDASRPVCYFMPDQPEDGTALMSDRYHVSNWALLRTRAEAVTFRAALSDEAVQALQKRMKQLSKFLY